MSWIRNTEMKINIIPRYFQESLDTKLAAYSDGTHLRNQFWNIFSTLQLPLIQECWRHHSDNSFAEELTTDESTWTLWVWCIYLHISVELVKICRCYNDHTKLKDIKSCLSARETTTSIESIWRRKFSKPNFHKFYIIMVWNFTIFRYFQVISLLHSSHSFNLTHIYFFNVKNLAMEVVFREVL